MKVFIIILVLLSLSWMAYSYYSSKAPQPKFTLESKNDDYEIRRYPAMLVAEVEVKGDYQEAMSASFRMLAGYIFGNNQARENIGMTAPVMENKAGENIGMTAPVLENTSGSDSRTVAFIMPERYTLATLPVPNDARVRLREMPEQRVAVLVYSGTNGAERVEKKKQELLGYLKRDGLLWEGPVRGARYNPPWTMPAMNHNEVHVTLKNPVE
jgi:effector-binding domain-containing protein